MADTLGSVTPASEIGAVVLVVLVAVVVVVRTTTRAARAVALASVGLVIGLTCALYRPEVHAAPPGPRPSARAGYVGSATCLPCHPGEHASFGRTFHRTMTQRASPAAVRAPLDGRPLPLDDRTVRLERRGDEVWATLPDPDAVIAGAPAPDVTRRVLLTTGSHREQAYWVAGKRAGDLRLVPFVWLVREEAFVPRRDAFITPPGVPLPPVRWASSCIACHAVAGEPRHDEATDTFDTRVAELGVACEACHGPGGSHVERHRDPVARWSQHRSKAPDPTIVHPARIAPERSAAVCGQCHAYAFPRDEAGFWTAGYAGSFRAGDLLAPSRTVLDPAALHGARGAPVIDAAPDAIFWPDGGARVGGREYNGLVASPCFTRGQGERKLTCLSCHAMHAGDPAGQIAPERTGDRACTTCHAGTPEHSHHAAGSSGAACVGCHMPKTSYALLSAVRSHRIDAPHASALGEHKPNACNLCHLDRSPAWTARYLADWYGQSAVLPSGERAETPAGLYDGLAGDAGVRALVADALSAAPVPFGIAVLEEMQSDPYAAVRFIAQRSLRSLRAGPKPVDVVPLDRARVRAVLAARDERAITIAE